ncbi:MAG: tetratricopeptide repeat protein [Planctomycetota bacterium]|jgi:tetratricopeptide (TPR) repeat protein
MTSEIERLRHKVDNYPSPSAFTRLAELLLAAGDAGEARALCQRCMRSFPRNGQAYVTLATIEHSIGNGEAATKLLNDAISQDPRCLAAYIQLADVAEQAGDHLRAIDMLRQATALRPRDQALSERLARLQAQVTAATSSEASASTTDSDSDSDTDIVDLSNWQQDQRTRSSALLVPPPAAHQPPAALNHLSNDDSVISATLADGMGRVLEAHTENDATAALTSALALELDRTLTQALACIDGGNLERWSLHGPSNEVIHLRHESGLAITSVVATGGKTAMIELRARQALDALGG